MSFAVASQLFSYTENRRENIPAKESRRKELLMKMNYKNENRTPRDRLSGELFFKEYGTSCPCRNMTARNAAEKRSPLASEPCGGGNCIDNFPLSMAYVPMQQWRELFCPEDALANGTLFKELVFPWYPTNCNGRECR